MRYFKDYINKISFLLRPGLVFGPNSETAHLKRAKILGEWVLKANDRVRCGTSNKIEQDIKYFEKFGKLPD